MTKEKLLKDLKTGQVWKRVRKTPHGNIKKETYYRIKYFDDGIVLVYKVDEEDEPIYDDGSGHDLYGRAEFDDARSNDRIQFVGDGE